MIALTSIAPSHRNGDMQPIAIQSWIDTGLQVVSFNCKDECETLRDKYKGVTFIESVDGRDLYGKPYVPIKSMLDYASKSDADSFVLINSDIILIDSYQVLEIIKQRLPNEATIVQRLDFANDINKHQTFQSGIDAFFIHKNHIKHIKSDGFYIGLCWWDYTVPYSLLTNHVKVNLLKTPLIYHRLHPTQYSMKSWEQLAKVFARVHGIKYRNAQSLNVNIYTYIFKHVHNDYLHQDI